MKAVAIAIVLATAALGPADVKTEVINYKGWAEAIRISNGTVELVVVPEIGRVMSYGYVGKENLLWEDPALAGKSVRTSGWADYGGDKLWFAPGSMWGSPPPDPVLDGSPWKWVRIGNGVRIWSGIGKKFPFGLSRTITMAPFGSNVTFVNSVANMGERDVAIGCWQSTQIDGRSKVTLPTERTSAQPNGFKVIRGGTLDPEFQRLLADKTLLIGRSKTKAYRIGSKSKLGEITANLNGLKFGVATRVQSRMTYADNDSALQVATSEDPFDYIELGVLAPLQRLAPREVQNQTVVWVLR